VSQQQPPEELDLYEIAEALVAVMDSQNAIIRMLWSIRGGVPQAQFLDDSDFQAINSRRQNSRNNLHRKVMSKKAADATRTRIRS
jgi:hypothetical protein